MKNSKMYAGLLAALAAVTLTACSTAGETGAEVESMRGTIQAEGSEPAYTAEQALEKAQTFMDSVAADVFSVSLVSGELQTVGEREVYLLTLKLSGSVYEPSLAVDGSSGILYSYYADGTLTPAAEDPLWTNFDSSQTAMTPEQQQNLAEAEGFAAEVVEEGTADFVLSMKTGRYAYADNNAVYIGYEGEVYQTLFHDGLNGLTPDETTLLARDVNFDGNDDILLMCSSGTVNTYYYLWLFDPAEGTFVACPNFDRLSSPTLNTSTQQITTYQRDSAVNFTQEVWKWDDTGSLTRVSSYAVAEDENSQVTVTAVDETGAETGFTVSEEEYLTANQLMDETLVDFAISRFGGSENRSFVFEGIQTVEETRCYSFMMREDGADSLRIFVDENDNRMAMLDADCDGTPEETVAMDAS